MTVITMSRQFGTYASEVAEKLCAQLSLSAFDKGLMMRVAAETGLSDMEIVDYSEEEYKLRNFLAALIHRSRTVAEVSSWAESKETAYERQVRSLDEEAAINLVRATVNAAYEHGDVLIIGRGGQVILEEKPNVVHVRLVAPFAARVGRVQAERQITAGQAWRLVAQRDRASRQYLQTFYHADLDDPTLYHLVLNTDRLSADACVDLVKAAVARVAVSAS